MAEAIQPHNLIKIKQFPHRSRVLMRLNQNHIVISMRQKSINDYTIIQYCAFVAASSDRNKIRFSGVKYFLKKTDIHRKIFLVRHAEYYRNYDRHTELNQIGSLTPKGRIQAYNAGLYLKQSGVKPTIMFYSDLLRARQTAGAIFNHFSDSLPIFCHSLLREVSYKITNSKVKFMVSSWY